MSAHISPNEIRDQVHLPAPIALEVVLQGIRIRLGRSIVTILGVALGIAFLMSILTSQLITKGVDQEQKTRAELRRMLSFLVADSGPLHERVIGIVQVGPLNEIEERFLDSIRRQNPTRIQWATPNPAIKPPPTAKQVPLASVAQESSAIIVMGEGDSGGLNWLDLLAAARQPVVAFVRTPAVKAVPPEGVVFVNLSRDLKPEEILAQAKQLKRDRYRTIWIIIISLLVTVIGISNSMLMSVTERFREIGTMKCLGALSSFIRRLFLIESTLIGSLGAFIGVLIGVLFPVILYGSSFGFGIVVSSLAWGLLAIYGVFSFIVGVILSVVAALYPARFASRMVPAAALRSNI